MPGPSGEMRRTADRGRWAQFYWGPWSSYLRDAVMAFAIGLMVVVAALIYIEGKKREDQFCLQAETEHKRNVDQYFATLELLDAVRVKNPEKLMDPVIGYIVQRLPDTEARARKDDAPPLCDGKSIRSLNPFSEPKEIGRPEPDPRLPRRTAEDVQRQVQQALRSQ